MSEITPVTHTEKVVAGQVDAVTHFEKVIAKYGGGGGGGGFTPTTEQLAAMNSGITSEDVEQISTNKNNISSILANIDITEITDAFTIPTGFTIDNKSHVYKQGKHIFGRLIIQSSNAYTVTPSIIVSAATYPPINNITNPAFYDNTSWTCRTLGSYFFGSNGQMSCVCQTGTTDTFVHINLDYVTP